MSFARIRIVGITKKNQVGIYVKEKKDIQLCVVVITKVYFPYLIKERFVVASQSR
jgi:hypothetical protein